MTKIIATLFAIFFILFSDVALSAGAAITPEWIAHAGGKDVIIPSEASGIIAEKDLRAALTKLITFDPVFAKADAMSKTMGAGTINVFTPAGAVFSVFAMIALMMSAVAMILNKSDVTNEFADFVLTGLTVMFFGYLLINYNEVVVVGISKFFNSWTSIAMGGVSPQEAVVNMVYDLVFSAVGVFAKAGTQIWSINPFKLFSGLALLIPMLFACYAILQAALAVILNILISNAVAAVGIVLGPVFVGFGAWEKSRSLFIQWLNMLLTAFGLKVVTVVLLTIVVSQFTNQLSYAINKGESFLGLEMIGDCFIIILYAYAIKAIAETAPSIASNLFGGVSFSSGNSAAGAAAGAALTTGDMAKDKLARESEKHQAAKLREREKQDSVSNRVADYIKSRGLTS